MTIQIGRYNQLRVRRLTRSGATLTDGELDVLLAKRWVPEDLDVGDSIEVFVFTDAEGVPLATTQRPRACVGECAFLTVNDVTQHGAFLDWGLDKDLFVPFAEQQGQMRRGGKYVVIVRLDDRGERIIGSARLSRNLQANANDFEVGQAVSLLVSRHTELGVQVIVDHRCLGLVYKDDIVSELVIGQSLPGFVRTVRADGKLDIALRATGSAGRDQDVQRLERALEAAGGELLLTDKSSPEEIARLTNMSKKAFKRAVGNLYRARKIELSERGIIRRG